MKIKSKFIFLILAILLTLPSLLGLLHAGFPQTDDGNWMVIRFSAFFEAFRNGQFPVRFLMRLNNGYGYPVADFLYPLFMYLGTSIHILKFSFVDTIKIILGLSIISSSVFCFWWLRKIFDNLASLIGAAVYTFIPYHLFDIYKRGSVGEVLSLAILPFVFWQIKRKSFIWASLGIGLLILAHNTLAVLFLPLIFLYMLLEGFTFSPLLMGLGLSAFFWIPAIADLKYTVFSQIQVSNWNNYFADINLIGLSTLFIFLLTLILIARGKNKQNKLTLLLLIIGLISIFFATTLSTQLWNFLPVSFVQFPFRVLSLTIPCAGFLSAWVVSVLSGKNKSIVAGIILILIITSSKQYLLPEKYQNYPDSFYSTNQDTTTVKNEYMPIWVKNIPLSMAKSKVENLNGEETINIVDVTPNKVLFNVLLPAPREIQVNTVYFPGWVAYINSIPTNIVFNNSTGMMRLSLQKGQNNVLVKFGETGLRLISDLISTTSLMVLFGIYLLTRKRGFNS